MGPQAHHPHLRRPQPPLLRVHVWCHLLPPFPRSAQLRPPQAWRQPHPIPPPPLLLHRLHPPYLPRLPAVPCTHRARADPADVRCQEHDVRCRSPSRPLPHAPPSSVAACPPRRSTSRCSTSRTRTPRTSSSGSRTTSSPPSVTSPRRVSRWPPSSSVTRPPSRSSGSASPSSSPACSAARPSSTGTPVRVWTRWSSPRLSPT